MILALPLSPEALGSHPFEPPGLLASSKLKVVRKSSAPATIEVVVERTLN